MRNLADPNGSVGGGGGTGAELKARRADWWEGFAHAVEDPHISIYDYLKTSLLQHLELEGANSAGEFFTKAQQKTLKELMALTDLREVGKTLKSIENNKIIFNPKARALLQCVRALIDAYITARDEYEKSLIKTGAPPPSAMEQRDDIKRIVRQKLADGELAEKIQNAAEAVTGRHRDHIVPTVQAAVEQLQEPRSLTRIARDVFGISRKYFTLDNAVTTAIYALPLITWNYRWALAIAFGAYVSRMAVVHGYRAGAALIGGDKEIARAQGVLALSALKHAGGNVLAIAITPLAARLPARFAVWSAFVANFVYKKSLEIGQRWIWFYGRPAVPDPEDAQRGWLSRAWRGVKGFFFENSESLVALSAKTAVHGRNDKISQNVIQAAECVDSREVRSLAQNLFLVGAAAGRRTGRWYGRLLEETFNTTVADGDPLGAHKLAFKPGRVFQDRVLEPA